MCPIFAVTKKLQNIENGSAFPPFTEQHRSNAFMKMNIFNQISKKFIEILILFNFYPRKGSLTSRNFSVKSSMCISFQILVALGITRVLVEHCQNVLVLTVSFQFDISDRK